MGTRLELHNKLEGFLGNKHVYYQPPASVKMEYPCIVYSKDNIKSTYADDAGYSFINRYVVTIISKMPDNDVIYKLLRFPYCSYDRHYVSDNLNHDVLILYY